MLVCKQCGYAFYRTSARTSKRKLYYYRCLGSDDYRYPNGRLCDNRPVRQDHLDGVVWQEIIRLLEDPALIRAEIERRIQAIQGAAPTKRREEALRRQSVRLQKSIERLLDAYQEELLPLEELRQRMPEIRKRAEAAQLELQSLRDFTVDRQNYLRLAETIEGFLSRLYSTADTLTVTDRQKVTRLLIKEILVGRDAITIRHSIPVSTSGQPPAPSGRTQTPGYLLRPGRRWTALRRSLFDCTHQPLFHDPGV